MLPTFGICSDVNFLRYLQGQSLRYLVIANLNHLRLFQLGGNWMTFVGSICAILVLIQRPRLVLEFIKDDQLQRRDPDHKLPNKNENLKYILPSPTLEEFRDKQ